MAGTIVPHFAGSPAAYAQALADMEQDARRRKRQPAAWTGWLAVVLTSAALLAGLDAALPLLPDHDGPETPFAAAPPAPAATVVILASPAPARLAAHKAPHRSAG